VLVGAVALGTAIVAASLFVRSLEGDSVRVDESARQVVLPADRTYGIYVDDTDNSGYSESCSVQDSTGQQVPLRSPGWTAASSDTETLDFVFDTGTGDLTISCSVPGEQVTAKPVPNILALVLGIVVAGILGVAALGFLILWLLARSSRPAAYATV
jgi:hypothetical protein